MKNIAIFCGSKSGTSPEYTRAARSLAHELFTRRLGLVYGGGKIGLMGVIADEMMRLGGEVIGVIPKKIKDMEVAHEGISELHIVESMHARKALMAEKSDGFIAMPGGIGTLEEIIEVFTWLQLDYHQKPCGFLNVSGYFDHLFEFLDHAVGEGFLSQEQRDRLIVAEDPDELLRRFLKG